jgi:hypothetical protein
MEAITAVRFRGLRPGLLTTQSSSSTSLRYLPRAVALDHLTSIHRLRSVDAAAYPRKSLPGLGR